MHVHNKNITKIKNRAYEQSYVRFEAMNEPINILETVCNDCTRVSRAQKKLTRSKRRTGVVWTRFARCHPHEPSWCLEMLHGTNYNRHKYSVYQKRGKEEYLGSKLRQSVLWTRFAHCNPPEPSWCLQMIDETNYNRNQ
jgi:hypothetical protein